MFGRFHDAGYQGLYGGLNNQEIKARKPDIVAMSALLTTTAPNQGKVIKALLQQGIRDDYIVLVGGGQLHRERSGLPRGESDPRHGFGDEQEYGGRRGRRSGIGGND